MKDQTTIIMTVIQSPEQGDIVREIRTSVFTKQSGVRILLELDPASSVTIEKEHLTIKYEFKTVNWRAQKSETRRVALS